MHDAAGPDQTRQTWAIGLSSWIVQDGNYPDLTSGQRAEFAIEFHVDGFERAEATASSARHVKDSWYDVTARVEFVSDDTWVIDCGVLAFKTLRPPPDGLVAGDWITASVSLGVDPYFYVEYLHRRPGMPALVYSWAIERIRLWAEPDYRDIDATDARVHGRPPGGAFYLLDCRRLAAPPQRHSATSRYAPAEEGHP